MKSRSKSSKRAKEQTYEAKTDTRIHLELT